MLRRSGLLVALAAVVALTTALTRVALADVPPITLPPTPTPTPTTSTPPGRPGASSPTTNPPTSASPTTPPTSPGATPSDAGGPGAPSPDLESTTAGVVPPEFQALIASVKRTPPNDTDALLHDLEPLQQFGLGPADAALLGFGHFPVAGRAHFSDDWWMPRFTPTFHLHQGTDIFADEGTIVRAPFDGVVTFATEAVGGLSAYVTLPDRTFLYSTHLSAFAPALVTGAAVKQGDVIGFVGATGNAAGGAAHVHFEIHPQGGPAVDPKAFLDQWIDEARAQAPALVARYAATGRAAAAPDGARRFAVAASAFTAPTASTDGPAGWAAAVSPVGGATRLAEAQVASGLAWRDVVGPYELRAAAWDRADAAARAALARLTPTPLRAFF